MQPKFQRVRCRYTYMNKKEKKQGPFQRPKKWFPKSQYKTVKKQWVFGLTTSNGKSLQFLVEKPRTGEQWAVDIKKRVGPFLKKAFPNLRSYRLLLDGEALLHKPVAKAELARQSISVVPGWPPYSCQLNPQEHVWSPRVVQITI